MARTINIVVGNIFWLETCMNSLVKVSPYSKWNFQGKIFFTQNWCNITLNTKKVKNDKVSPRHNYYFQLILIFLFSSNYYYSGNYQISVLLSVNLMTSFPCKIYTKYNERKQVLLSLYNYEICDINHVDMHINVWLTYL